MTSDLLSIVAAVSRDPASADVLNAASRAVLSELDKPDAFAGLEPETRDTLFVTLLEQRACPERPLIFAHEVAARISSDERQRLPDLVAALRPTLLAYLEKGPVDPESFKNVVVFLLTIRAFLGDSPTDAEIKKLHLTWVERFEVADFALPYSVMFNADCYGQNRAELLDHFSIASGQPLSQAAYALGAAYVLQLLWIAGPEVDPQVNLGALGGDTPADHAALRALRLRAGGTVPGLDDITPAPRTTAPNPAARLNSKANLAIQAGLTLVQKSAPFLATLGRTPRVAISVSGQLRGFEATFETWKNTLLVGCEPHVFVHSWKNKGQAPAQPFRQVLPFEGPSFCDTYRRIANDMGFETIQDRFPALFTALNTTGVADLDGIKALYGTDHVVLDDEATGPFPTFSNQQKMHYKIHAAHKMTEAAGPFDLYLRIRPDLPVQIKAFSWGDMIDAVQHDNMLFSEKPYGIHYGHLMMGDQFALSSKAGMDRFAGAWDTYPRLAEAQVFGCPAEFTGHTSLAMTCWLQGIQNAKVPARFGPLQGAQPLGSDQILAALEADAGNDPETTALMTAAQDDIKRRR